MYKTTRQIFALLWLVVISACTGGSVDSIDGSSAETAADAIAAPDQILSNGKILTVDADFNIVEAIALDGDRILAIGSSEEMLALDSADATVATSR